MLVTPRFPLLPGFALLPAVLSGLLLALSFPGGPGFDPIRRTVCAPDC